MKIRIKNLPYYLVAGYLLLTTSITFAAQGSTVGSAADELKAQAIEIEKQMIALRAQMAALEEKQKQFLQVSQQNPPKEPVVEKTKVEDNSKPELAKPFETKTVKVESPTVKAIPTVKTKDAIESREFTENEEIEEFQTLPYGDTHLANIGGTAVITTPFIQSRYDFRGSNLITNYSAINKDVAALYQRLNFAYQMKKAGLTMPNFPLLAVSGQLEGAIVGGREFNGTHSNDIDLTTAELDFQAMVNEDFTGFMSLVYDNSPPLLGQRISNSKFGLDNGFITWGNLDKSPFYATIGQLYVPFGQFTTYLISDPLNKTMFRTKARALVLGYQSQNIDETGPYASIYGFRGDSRTGPIDPTLTVRSPNRQIDTFGANLGYSFAKGDWQGDLGVSVINNVADARGMQSTGGSIFEGFAESSAAEVLAHRVPGVDVRGMIIWKSWNFIAEYTTATRAFDDFNLSFNDEGAKPSAYHTEIAYAFEMFDNPSTFVVGYDHSDEALALNIPKRRYAAALSTAIWQNTLASLEYNYGMNYKKADVASGAGSPDFIRPGKSSHAVIGHFDVYF